LSLLDLYLISMTGILVTLVLIQSR